MADVRDLPPPVVVAGERLQLRVMRWGRRAVRSSLGAAGCLLMATRGVAQVPSDSQYVARHAPSARLTLRPRALATGTQTTQAGWSALDQLDARRLDSLGLDSLEVGPPSIYAPSQCVGARRCPLLVMVGGVDPDWFVPVADKYGILLFVPGGYPSMQEPWVRYLDAYLREALRQLAVDPDKIALEGHCGGGPNAFWFGRTNMDVFSRVIVASPEGHVDVAEPKHGAAEFLLVASMDDTELQMYYAWLLQAQVLRRDGIPVTQVLSLRPHMHRLEEFDLMGRWLQASWAEPGRLGRVEWRIADTVPDTLPLLTVDAVSRLRVFWTGFTQEPESVWVAGRLKRERFRTDDQALVPNAAALLKATVIPVGEERVTVLISDFPALAAKYPPVAAKLEAAGLTAPEAEAYRLALLSARATWHAAEVAPGLAGGVAPGSVLGQNVAFLKTHPDVMAEFATSGVNAEPEYSAMWLNP